MSSEWRPIESAPRDGRVILLVRGNAVEAGYWHIHPNCREFSENERDFPWAFLDPENLINGWRDDGGKFGPTHWLPLPEPPSEEERETSLELTGGV